MSRPTPEDLRLMDRMTLAVLRYGEQKSAMGYPRKDFAFDNYIIRRWEGRTTLFFVYLGGDSKRVFSWDHTTKEIEIKEELHLPGVADVLDRLLVLEDLSDV